MRRMVNYSGATLWLGGQYVRFLTKKEGKCVKCSLSFQYLGSLYGY